MCILKFLIAACVPLLCGCAYDARIYNKGTGDMGQFLLQQAIKLGACPVATNSLPVIGGEWGYSEDKGGMMFRLSRERFSEVQKFLLQAFGSPIQEPVHTRDGGKVGWYSPATIGTGLMFSYDPKWTEIIIDRAVVPASEINKRPPEALKKDFQ